MGVITLEHEEYDVWAQGTCNLYCARRNDGKRKEKGGDFKVEPTSLGEALTKAKAVKKMCIAALIDGTHPRATLGSLVPKDFVMSASVKEMSFVYDDAVLSRKVLRYYVSKSGKILRKEGAKVSQVVAGGALVRLADRLDGIDDIDYDWYIERALVQTLNITCETRTPGGTLPKKVEQDLEKYYGLSILR